MNRRNFVTKTTLAAAAAPIMMSYASVPSNNEVYELRKYELTGRGQIAVLTDFLEKALIPALNRLQVKNVGVFSEIGRTEPPKVYVLIPYLSSQAYFSSKASLDLDEVYKEARQSYDAIPVSNKVFYRYETELMVAFDSIKELRLPDTQERIFELRTYQGYSDDAVRRKIKMFDKEELDLFYQKKLNPVFFGKVIAGKELPKLTYMLTFKDLEERDKNWKNFFVDNPVWDRIKNAKEYANTVSRVDRTFLEPLSISQI